MLEFQINLPFFQQKDIKYLVLLMTGKRNLQQ